MRTALIPVGLLLSVALTGCNGSGSAESTPTGSVPARTGAGTGVATVAAPDPADTSTTGGAPGTAATASRPTGTAGSAPATKDEPVSVACNAGACKLVYPASMSDAQVRAAFVARALKHPATGATVKFGVLPLGGAPTVPAVAAPQGAAKGGPLAKNVVVDVTCAREVKKATNPAEAFWYRMKDGRFVSGPQLIPVEKGTVRPC